MTMFESKTEPVICQRLETYLVFNTSTLLRFAPGLFMLPFSRLLRLFGDRLGQPEFYPRGSGRVFARDSIIGLSQPDWPPTGDAHGYLTSQRASQGPSFSSAA